jgi:hypothetical protein
VSINLTKPKPEEKKLRLREVASLRAYERNEQYALSADYNVEIGLLLRLPHQVTGYLDDELVSCWRCVISGQINPSSWLGRRVCEQDERSVGLIGCAASRDGQAVYLKVWF